MDELEKNVIDVEPVKKEIDTTSKYIKIPNSYFERMNLEPFQTLSKTRFKSQKVQYWFSRAVEKLQSESKTYYDEKKKLVEEFAEKDEDGNPRMENNQPVWKDIDGFLKKWIELQTAETDIPMERFTYDWENAPDLTREEMDMLVPLIKPPSM